MSLVAGANVTITPSGNTLQISASGASAWGLTGNAGTTGANFLGTTDDRALELKVKNQRALRLEPHGLSPNLLGGSVHNVVTAGAIGATIAGGGGFDFGPLPNQVTDHFGTVGGGESNTAGNGSGTIDDATYATVGGGQNNTASGSHATVPGGGDNTAAGEYSFAAGSQAKANHVGSFVWADATAGDFASTAQNQFNVRARGGLRLDESTSVSFGRQTRQMLNLWGAGYGIGVQAATLYQRTDGVFAWHKGGSHSDNFADPGPGGSQLMGLDDNFLMVRGGGGERAYLGGDGAGGDVQVGSLNPGIANVAFYNAANNNYMHVICKAITITGGADLAEPFEMSSQEIPEGAVVIIDRKNPGRLKMSDHAYDTHVAGIVSGAGGINPGIQLKQAGVLEHGRNVALTGRVYALADASAGPIEPGDLLTTSSVPGHAMKVTDHAKAQGAILGKAMGALSEGKGLVLVLVTLQ